MHAIQRHEVLLSALNPPRPVSITRLRATVVMDHNGAFTADENVDVVHRTEAGRSRVGENAMLAAEGGIEIRGKSSSRVSQTERSPLLNPQTADSDDERDTYRSTWANGVEWEHLPWYKRPSVRASTLIYGSRDTDVPLLALLAPLPVRFLRAGLWRNTCPQDQPHPGPHMPRILCRQGCLRESRLYVLPCCSIQRRCR